MFFVYRSRYRCNTSGCVDCPQTRSLTAIEFTKHPQYTMRISEECRKKCRIVAAGDKGSHVDLRGSAYRYRETETITSDAVILSERNTSTRKRNEIC